MVSANKQYFGFFLVVCILLVAFPNVSNAERFADLMVGISHAEKADINYSTGDVGEVSNANFDSSFAIGYRMGYWFEQIPFLGLALEVDYTSIEDGGDQDIDVLSFSALAMFRLQLMKSEAYPDGEWSPFIAVGPGLFLSEINYEVANSPVPEMIGMPTLSGEYEDSQTDFGFDLRAGVKKWMAPNWAINLEYRFFYFEPKYEDNVLGNDVRTDVDLYTHSILLGMTYNF